MTPQARHVLKLPIFRRLIRVKKFFLVLLDVVGTEGSHILTALLSPLQLVLPADIHSPLCPHDYHLRRGPGENEVRPKLPGAHCRPAPPTTFPTAITIFGTVASAQA